MDQINPKLKKFFFQKLNEDISDKEIHTNESELWVIDEETRDWYIQASSNGELFYNQKFFNHYGVLFSLDTRTLSNTIREWFEKNFELPIRTSARKQGSMEYHISNFLKKKKGILEYNNRYGFPYGFAKKYISVKKYNGKVLVEDYLLFD